MANIVIQRIKDAADQPIPLFQEIEKRFGEVRQRVRCPQYGGLVISRSTLFGSSVPSRSYASPCFTIGSFNIAAVATKRGSAAEDATLDPRWAKSVMVLGELYAAPLTSTRFATDTERSSVAQGGGNAVRSGRSISMRIEHARGATTLPGEDVPSSKTHEFQLVTNKTDLIASMLLVPWVRCISCNMKPGDPSPKERP